jgi:hypothetical protein
MASISLTVAIGMSASTLLVVARAFAASLMLVGQ